VRFALLTDISRAADAHMLEQIGYAISFAAEDDLNTSFTDTTFTILLPPSGTPDPAEGFQTAVASFTVLGKSHGGDAPGKPRCHRRHEPAGVDPATANGTTDLVSQGGRGAADPAASLSSQLLSGADPVAVVAAPSQSGMNQDACYSCALWLWASIIPNKNVLVRRTVIVIEQTGGSWWCCAKQNLHSLLQKGYTSPPHVRVRLRSPFNASFCS